MISTMERMRNKNKSNMSNLYAKGIKMRTQDHQLGSYVNIEKVILTQK